MNKISTVLGGKFDYRSIHLKHCHTIDCPQKLRNVWSAIDFDGL